MTIDSFYTVPIGNAAQSKNLLQPQAVKPGTPQGLAFFDLFLANLEQSLTTPQGPASQAQTAPQAPVDPNQKQQEKTENIFLHILANSAYSREELSKLEDPTLGDVLGLNQQIDDEALLSIELPGTQGVSSVQQSIILTTEADYRPALSNLQRILQKISALLEQEDPALINTNLDAAQITDLQQKVDALLNNKDTQIDGAEFAGVFAGLISIIPPQNRPEIVITGKSIVISNTPLNANGGQKGAANDSASRMTNLLFPQQNSDALNTDPELGTEDSVTDLIKTMGKKDGSFDLALQKSNAAANNAGGIGNNIQIKTLPDLSLMQNLSLGSYPLLSGSDLSTAMIDELGLSLSSFSASQPAGLTALVTQSGHASLPHPGTQMVAATLHRAGSSGNPNGIVLQLDPPELGRVEVKMSFEPGSKIKAVLTVEKPETMLMLQRDQQMLERALQGAGLDSEGGLSFELADQDHPFGQNGAHDGSRNASGSQEDSEQSSEDLIETTMTWMVDPQTGHMKYNIYA